MKKNFSSLNTWEKIDEKSRKYRMHFKFEITDSYF